MDYQEAIKAIKSNYPPSNYTILREALDLAIETLEKQTPKKPVKYSMQRNEQTWICPTCNRLYWKRDHLDSYCMSCGQKFDLK